MTTVALRQTAEIIEETYRARTAKSATLYEAASTVMPGGNTRSALHYAPYPTFLQEGHGCRVKDVDQNEYIDFLSNYTSLIHGHAHPAIVRALHEQALRGTAFASPTYTQTRLAQLLIARIPSLERLRFCNSGTEATLMAIRAAKAFTRRNKILKLDGGYHGTHDAALVACSEDPDAAEPNLGLFRGVVADVLSMPANDVRSAAQLFDLHGRDLAAVIVEPVMGAGGMLPLDAEFIHFLSGAARSCGALFILDEVITFRLATGGAQEIYSVRPDLTTLGKVIGGGVPVGAFGGRADVMALFEPGNGRLAHSGTFNGNEATMAAGIVAVELLTEDAIRRINQVGDRLREGLHEVFGRTGVAAQVTGIGSLVGLHFTSKPPRNYRDTLQSSRKVLPLLHLSLMNRGMFLAPRGFVCISTPMAETEIDMFLGALEQSLLDLKPEFQKVDSL